MVGTSIGHYQVTAQVGAGGMGEVWRARDTRLEREVAIKILPKEFAENPDRLRRFQHEAKTLAALDHPNLLVIFDFGQHESQPYLVSELLDGHTLRDELANGPLSQRKALDYALQLAQGLGAAHGKGIVHRDLKPENVFVTKEGRVKVLDFGLAKLQTVRPTGEAPACVAPPLAGPNAVTETARSRAPEGTVPGVVLGTPNYMSPEQVRGEEADLRSDIFAFGVVLFEMLTGQQAFRRGTRVQTMNAILCDDAPELIGLHPNLSPAVDRLVRRCMEKEPERRWQNAGDLAFAIDGMGAGSTSAIASLSPRFPQRFWLVPWAAWVVLLVAFLAVVWRPGWFFANRLSPRAGGVLRKLEIELPNATNGISELLGLALAPDGRKFIYSLRQGLWLRWLDRESAPVLLTPKKTQAPFWSPHSTDVGFFAEGNLWTESIAGGEPHLVCTVSAKDTTFAQSATWLSNDQILFSCFDPRVDFTSGAAPGQGILGVSATGGEPKVVLPLEEHRVYGMDRLPGGRGIIFTGVKRGLQETVIAVWTPGQVQKVVLKVPGIAFGSAYSSSGHVLFGRPEGGAFSGFAFPFSINHLERTGEPFRVATSVVAGESVSEDGTWLVFKYQAPHSGSHQLVSVNRSGKVTGSIGDPMEGLESIRLSPDGERLLALGQVDGQIRLRIVDVARGLVMPLTLSETNSVAMWGCSWMPDSHTVLFNRRDATNGLKIYRKDIDDLRPEEELMEGCILALSADGRHLIYADASGKGSLRYSRYEDRGRKPVGLEWLGSFTIAGAPTLKLSQDGSLLAYLKGKELYLVEFPGLTNRTLVARGNLSHLRWAAASSELFFTQDQWLIAVTVKRGPPLEVGQPIKLFDMQPFCDAVQQIASFDVTAAGDRFICIRPGQPNTEGARKLKALLIENWFEEFRDKQSRKQ